MLKLLLATLLVATLSARNIIQIDQEDVTGLVTISTEDYVILPPNHPIEHNVFFNPKGYVICTSDECVLTYVALINRKYKSSGINFIYIGDK